MAEPELPETPGPEIEQDAARARVLPDPDALFARIAAETIARAPTARERLQERPTVQRIAIAAIAVVGTGVLMVALQGRRPDLAEVWPRLLPLELATAALALTAAALTLRPLHRPPRPLAAAPLLALLLGSASAASHLWPGMPTPPPGLAPHLGCTLATLAGTTLATAAILSVDRSRGLVRWRAALAATAAGLAAAAAQSLFCPLAQPAHLLGAHLGPGWLLTILLAALATARRT